MSSRVLYIVCFLYFICGTSVFCQVDDTPPDTPVMQLVTVNNNNGTINVSWSKSLSEDVSGYVIYNYQNEEGYAIDTIRDASITNYYQIPIVGASYFSQSFVVAAFDTAGNISPLSNELSTIYIETVVDSCNKIIEIAWSEYPSFPSLVTEYELLTSTDGINWLLLSTTSNETHNYSVTDFETDKRYFYKVKAILEDNRSSESNQVVVNTKMQNPPNWINADYATVATTNRIDISFSIDPNSEIYTYNIERKGLNDSSYTLLASLTSQNSRVKYSDKSAQEDHIYSYRLAAINNCGNPIVYSNIASNIVLQVNRPDDNTILLDWNLYKRWNGEISEQSIIINTGNGIDRTVSLLPSDTTVTLQYDNIIDQIVSNEICFTVKAIESNNPRGINSEAISRQVCIPIIENVTVPNLFTPDGNMINDHFRPVLSFIPTDYYLLITDLNRRKVYETRSYEEEWDGQFNGSKLPEGTYLWMIRVTTPTGSVISKSGTVNILFNL